MFREMISELIEYRELLYILTWRDIKVRYKQSVMGFLWAILMPLMVFAAGLVVKVGVSFVSGKPLVLGDHALLMVKALPWSFFIGSIKFATASLITNNNLVSKVYFPRELFPLAAVLTNLFDFALAAIPVTILLLLSGVGVSWYLFWLPVLFVLLFLLTAGLALLLSCANLFFRDVKYIVEIVLTFAIFFTPVLYEASMFGKWASVLQLNPVGALLEAISAVTIGHRAPEMVWVAYAAVCSIVTFGFSWITFHRAEFMFAERL